MREELGNMSEDALNHFMENLPLKFRVMNLQVEMGAQIEFFDLLQQARKQPVVDDVEGAEERLKNAEIEVQERKQLLAQLCLVDKVEVMRALEHYATSCPDDIKDFAQLAAYQSKLFLEASILGEAQVVVASGLGGDGDKLRFFVALISRSRQPFSEAQQQIMQKEIAYQLKQSNVVFEKISFESCYAQVLALIPMRTNVRAIFERCIEMCNELGNFLDGNMIISTVKFHNAEELDEMVAEGDK